MIELSKHIEVLLLDNDCVIVPGFGGFITQYTPATYIEKENLFLPPMRTLGFNPQLKLNDGLLIQSYMAAHHTDYADANKKIEHAVQAISTELYSKGKVELPNIGELHCNIHNQYEFTPFNNKLTSPSLYGLDSFEIKPIKALRKPVTHTPVYTLEPEAPTYHIHINRAFLRNTVAAVIAILLFFSYSTPVENTSIDNSSYARILPDNLFEQVILSPADHQEEVSVVAPVQTKESITNLHVSTIEEKAEVSEIQTKKQSESAKVQEPKVTEKAIVTNVPDHFFIIVAGGITMKDAQAMAEDLQNKGYSKAMAMDCNGKIRVSIQSFANRLQANEALTEIRKDPSHKEAWLLVQK